MRIANIRLELRTSLLIILAAAIQMVALASPVTAQTAHYRVTFDATWSATTHPQSFPGNPHFSGLVGGTHDDSIAFWTEGENASLGIKRVAEWGSKTALLAEVQAAINAGQAEFQLSGPSMSPAPNTVTYDFTVNPDFPLVSMVTMIAPSPDWFVGVESLDLRPGGEWAEEIVIDLYPWDSGTDSGTNYTSGDQITNPPVPIFQITGTPFTPGVSLGTFTFTRLYVSAVPEAPALQVSAFPNPFNPRTTIAWELPRDGHLTVEIFDIKGRRVDTLWDRTAEAGPGRVSWDGTDRSGRSVFAGKYFYRLRQGPLTQTGSMMLIK